MIFLDIDNTLIDHNQSKAIAITKNCDDGFTFWSQTPELMIKLTNCYNFDFILGVASSYGKTASMYDKLRS